MLKFRITMPKTSVDAKALNIIETRFLEDEKNYSYDDIDEELGMVNINKNQQVITFEAEDIYGIQADSHLTGANRVTLSNEDGTSINTYDYVEKLVVETASKSDNTFSVRINKDFPLTIANIFLETRYNAIQFDGSNWGIFSVGKEWLKENGVYGNKELLINTDEVACGKNLRPIQFETTDSDGNIQINLYHDYQVFYYENNVWKTVNLMDDSPEDNKIKFEDCLNEDGTLNFIFFEYDESNRKKKDLDTNQIYYTRETYIYFECDYTHFFTNPKEIYRTNDEEEMVSVEYTEYGKPKIIKVEFPEVTFSYDTSNNGIIMTNKIVINCHRDSDNSLSFNYDGLSEGERKVILNKLFPFGPEIDFEKDYPKQEGNNGVFNITRSNIMYNSEYSDFNIIYDSSINTIQIPMSQLFETDMFHNDALNVNFTEVEKANAVNPIMDLEKDVYLPVIMRPQTPVDGKYIHINAPYQDCFKIIFNLHFREHRDTISGDKWKCENESYWNGTTVLNKTFKDDNGNDFDKKIIDLKGRVYQYDNDDAKSEKYDYFSYFGVVPTNKAPKSKKEDGFDNPFEENKSESKLNNDYNIEYTKYKEERESRNKLKEYQSDLLSYLGFSNNDVKYQKSKLKKSFLRISFYDSDNIANQNLLHTATIFLDSGNLFAKYVRNIETDDLYKVKSTFTQNNISYDEGELIEGKIYRCLDEKNQKICVIGGRPMAVIGSSSNYEDQYTSYDKNGLRVNREPMRSSAIDAEGFKDNVSDLEDLRMSSQIEVTDKYSSKRSSEGFYFYTYKRADGGVFPSDIYMRVEFNHAGYGRTIPFMMPYIRKVEETIGRYSDRPNKIKTFDDICYDWSEIDYDTGVAETDIKDENDVGYGTLRYMKYSYIKLKYRYDKNTQKHIYYLDPDVYGEGVTTSNGHGNNIILNLYEGKIR